MLLNDTIQSLSDEFETKVQVIATTHNITDEKVRKLLGSYKYYWNPHSMQLANAIIHDKVHEVNKGKLTPWSCSSIFTLGRSCSWGEALPPADSRVGKG